jgi:hypothetical protein
MRVADELPSQGGQIMNIDKSPTDCGNAGDGPLAVHDLSIFMT